MGVLTHFSHWYGIYCEVTGKSARTLQKASFFSCFQRSVAPQEVHQALRTSWFFSLRCQKIKGIRMYQVSANQILGIKWINDCTVCGSLQEDATSVLGFASGLLIFGEPPNKPSSFCRNPKAWWGRFSRRELLGGISRAYLWETWNALKCYETRPVLFSFLV